MSIIYCIAINTCTHTLTRLHTLAAAGVKENEVQRNLNEIQYIRKNQSNFISYLWDKAKESHASSVIKCNSTHVYSEKEEEEKNKPKARYLHALWFKPHGSLIIDQAAEWHFKWYWMKMQSSKVILSGYVRCLSLIATIIHTQNGIPYLNASKHERDEEISMVRLPLDFCTWKMAINNFDCIFSYLQHFMQCMNWSQLQPKAGVKQFI